MGRNKQVQCNVCKKEIRSDHLARHMRIHGGVKKFACDQCNYQTLRKYDLKRHKKSIHWTKENTRAMDDEKIQNGNKNQESMLRIISFNVTYVNMEVIEIGLLNDI